MIKPIFYTVLLTTVSAAISSCTNTKNLQYLQGDFDTAKLGRYTIPEAIIQKGDLMGITVYSDNAKATFIYNQSVTGNATVTNSALPSTNVPGYLVDEEGNIQFQGVGKLHVEGLTKGGLARLLNTNLKDTLLTNPYYNIRFLNYKITILGDVAKPAVYTVPAEKVNILEALALAGDLNITARRDNVRVIREENGKRSFGEIDLRQSNIFNNPFYQLHQNDIIYVDLNKTKASANDQTAVRNITIATSVISTIAIIISVIRR